MRYTHEVTYLAVDGTRRTTAAFCCHSLVTTPVPPPTQEEVERLMADYQAIPIVPEEFLASRSVSLEGLMQALHGILSELGAPAFKNSNHQRNALLHIDRLILSRAIHLQRINHFPTNEQFSEAAHLTPESGEQIAKYCLACAEYLEGTHD